MTPQEIDTLRNLRSQGYAVVIFNSEELKGADPDRVEDRLIELGWEVIDCLKVGTDD